MLRTNHNFSENGSSRDWLNSQTEIAIKTRDELLANAATEYEAFRALSLSINDILLCMYEDMTAESGWRTLKDWEKLGYKLKENEKPFYVWGNRLSLLEQDRVDNDEVTKNLTVMTVYSNAQVVNETLNQRRKEFEYQASLLSVNIDSEGGAIIRIKNGPQGGNVREIKKNELFVLGGGKFNLAILKNKTSARWEVLDLDSGAVRAIPDNTNVFKDRGGDNSGVVAS